MDIPDIVCELSQLTTLIISFHIDTTFTWHMDTLFQDKGLNHT